VARVAQSLLSFARQAPAERVFVDLNHIVEQTLFLVEKPMTADGIRITATLDRTLPVVSGDAGALQQVLLNLLTNSRDAMEGGGEIRIETGPSPGRPGWLRLVVADTGSGIAPEHFPKIFDPFFTTKADGTGLGLSVSYGIIQDHGGTVDVQSEPGKGTTFILTFPSVGSPSEEA
jgi:signal transduction histidine kinase